MWLGILAILVAFGYALTKFLTTLHMRRLRENATRLQGDLKRERQRLQAMEGKRQVERARFGETQQKLGNARRFKEDLFGRLRLELPSTMADDLRKCVNRHPVPEPAGVKTAHELHLADRVNEALSSLSILVVEFGDDAEGGSGARTLLQGELVKDLRRLEILYSGPKPVKDGFEEGPTRLVTAFDEPGKALKVVRRLARSHADHIVTVRATLVAGMALSELDQDNVNRRFARALLGAEQLLNSAPEASLLVNEQAREFLGDHDDITEHNAVEKTWILSLTDAAAVPAESPANGKAPADTARADTATTETATTEADGTPVRVAAPDDGTAPETDPPREDKP